MDEEWNAGCGDYIAWLDGQRKKAAPRMREVCMALVQELYQNYRSARSYNPRAKEPEISVSFLREYLAQAGRVGEGIAVPKVFHMIGYRKQAALVRNAVEALVRAGKLETSVGNGSRGHTDTRHYNLVEVNQ